MRLFVSFLFAVIGLLPARGPALAADTAANPPAPMHLLRATGMQLETAPNSLRKAIAADAQAEPAERALAQALVDYEGAWVNSLRGRLQDLPLPGSERWRSVVLRCELMIEPDGRVRELQLSGDNPPAALRSALQEAILSQPPLPPVPARADGSRKAMRISRSLSFVSAIDMQAFGLAERYGAAARLFLLEPEQTELEVDLSAGVRPRFEVAKALAEKKMETLPDTPLPVMRNASPLSAAMLRSLSGQAPLGLAVLMRARLVRGNGAWRLASDHAEYLLDDAASIGCAMDDPSDFAPGTHDKSWSAIAFQRAPASAPQYGQPLALRIGELDYRAQPGELPGCHRFSERGPLYVDRRIETSDVLRIQAGTAAPVRFSAPADLQPWVLVQLEDGSEHIAPARIDTLVFEPGLDAVRASWRAPLWNDPPIARLWAGALLPGEPAGDSALARYLRNCRPPQRYRLEPCSHPDFPAWAELRRAAVAEARKVIAAQSK